MSVEEPVAPVSDAMEGVVESTSGAEPTAELADTAAEEAQESPEVPAVIASETLYIQNLNEKIKVDGVLLHYLALNPHIQLVCSHESHPKGTVQIIWHCSRCNCTSKLAHEGASFCLI